MKELELRSVKKYLKGGGEYKMKLVRMIIVLICMWMLTGVGYTGTTENFNILITPTLNYSVLVSTDGTTSANLNLNYDSPGQMFISTGVSFAGLSITTATVYNNGNTRADWQVNASIRNTAGTKAWAFGEADKNTVGVDSITLCVVLGSTNQRITTVTDATFDNTTDLVYRTGAQWHNLKNPNFMVDYDGDNVDPPVFGFNTRLLFYRLRMPTDTSNQDPEEVTINIRAVATGTF